MKPDGKTEQAICCLHALSKRYGDLLKMAEDLQKSIKGDAENLEYIRGETTVTQLGLFWAKHRLVEEQLLARAERLSELERIILDECDVLFEVTGRPVSATILNQAVANALPEGMKFDTLGIAGAIRALVENNFLIRGVAGRDNPDHVGMYWTAITDLKADIESDRKAMIDAGTIVLEGTDVKMGEFPPGVIPLRPRAKS